MSDNSSIKLQYLGTIIALVISSMALLVSVYEATIMQSQQKAMVWPYVKISTGYSYDGFTVYASNNGIGPALIESVEVQINGKAVSSFDALLDAAQPDRTFGYDIVKMGSLNGTVIKAGEKRMFLRFPINEQTQPALKNMNNVNVKLQFNSVLGDSWVFDLQSDKVREGTFKSSLEFEN